MLLKTISEDEKIRALRKVKRAAVVMAILIVVYVTIAAGAAKKPAADKPGNFFAGLTALVVNAGPVGGLALLGSGLAAACVFIFLGPLVEDWEVRKHKDAGRLDPIVNPWSLWVRLCGWTLIIFCAFGFIIYLRG